MAGRILIRQHPGAVLPGAGDKKMDLLKAKNGINAAGQTNGRVLRPMLS